MRFSDFKDFVA